MFATFPVKPILRTKEFKPPPKALKREHRVARVYEPISPTNLPARPRSARTQPDRPAPILALPGLPPLSLPKSVIKNRQKGFADGWLESGRTWLAQFRPPWAKRISTIPEPTPRTAQFVNERRYGYSSGKPDKFDGDDREAYLEDDVSECRRDPPPLYKKHAPEGGIIGWSTVAGAFLIQFCTIGYLFTWNVFEDHYNHVSLTDQNPMVVRFIGSIQWFLAFFLSLVAGKLADSGFFQYSVLSGSGLFSVCLFLLSLVGEEEFGRVFACQALGMGVGIGLVFVPTATVPLHYFKRQKGLAIGIVMSGGSFGGMIFPAVLRGLIPQRGLGGAVRVTAYIILGCLVIANCLLVTPPKEEKPVYPLPHLDLAKYTKEIEYLFAAGGTFVTMLVIYYPVWYLDLLGLEKGVDPKSAFTSVVVLSLTGFLGRVGLGFASDMYGPWNLLIPVNGGLALMLFTTCAVQGTKSLVAVSIFYGIFSGAWLSLMVTALSSLASRMSETGTRVGLILSISSFGALFSALIQDGMLTPKHVWVIPSVVCGVVLLGVTALAYLSRMSLAGKKANTSRHFIQGILIL